MPKFAKIYVWCLEAWRYCPSSFGSTPCELRDRKVKVSSKLHLSTSQPRKVIIKRAGTYRFDRNSKAQHMIYRIEEPALMSVCRFDNLNESESLHESWSTPPLFLSFLLWLIICVCYSELANSWYYPQPHLISSEYVSRCEVMPIARQVLCCCRMANVVTSTRCARTFLRLFKAYLSACLS